MDTSCNLFGGGKPRCDRQDRPSNPHCDRQDSPRAEIAPFSLVGSMARGLDGSMRSLDEIVSLGHPVARKSDMYCSETLLLGNPIAESRADLSLSHGRGNACDWHGTFPFAWPRRGARNPHSVDREEQGGERVRAESGERFVFTPRRSHYFSARDGVILLRELDFQSSRSGTIAMRRCPWKSAASP